jgi:hypothetical protein
VRQKYDQGYFLGCNITLDERRSRARKRWHGKYIHRPGGANGPRRTRNEKQRLDSAAQRSDESQDDKHQSESGREKLYTATKRTPVSKESEGLSKVNFGFYVDP